MHDNNSHTHAPALSSPVRIASLLTSLLVALASGTNYVFSAYGPQLGARLHLSHTQLNVIGLSGNVGVYSTSPILGKIVDVKGPRILLVMSFITLLAGYSGIRHFYDAGLPDGVSDISLFSLCLLVFCGFSTGVGGNGGLVSSINATAKSFPDRARATTTGLVLSGFGLSAFLFSTVAHVAFPGNTSSFLLLLAVGTSLPMVLGFFFVKPVPLPPSEADHVVEHGNLYTHEDDFSAESPSVFQRENNSHTHLLQHDVDMEDEEALSSNEELEELEEIDEPIPVSASHHLQETTDYVVPESARSLALSPTRLSESRHRSRGSLSVNDRRRRVSHRKFGPDGLPNISGMMLGRSRNFWLLFTITSLLSGTGLMYINNVGSIAQALFANGNPDYDEIKSAQFQALQVSTISITNCLGRLLIGLLADFTKNYLHLPRSFCITVVATLFVISQIALFTIEDIDHLWKASASLGLAHGSLFGLFPTITIEWFGLPHFSENWGFVSLSPMIGGNIFSIAFGRNFDAHAPSSPSLSPTAPPINATLSTILSTASTSIQPSTSALLIRRGLPSDHQCFDGRVCYADSVKMTIAACCLALCLGVYAGWRDWRRYGRGGVRRERVLPPLATEIVWADED